MSLADYRARGLKAHKYGAKAVVIDGMRFDSTAEGNHYQKLSNLWHAGAIKWFTRQVPFRLPGGVIYRADFLVVYIDGSIAVQDVKGFLTEAAKIKLKQMAEIYGFEVELIGKQGVRREPRKRR